MDLLNIQFSDRSLIQFMQENIKRKKTGDGDAGAAAPGAGGDAGDQQSDGTDGEDAEPAVAQPELD